MVEAFVAASITISPRPPTSPACPVKLWRDADVKHCIMASLVDSAAHAITYEAVPLHRFSGQRGEDIELWLQSFTMHQTAQAWSDVYTISMASLHLDGHARRWSFQFNKATSWSAFQCNMLKQYGDSQTVSWLRLQNCRQQVGQSVSVFAQTLRLRMDKHTPLMSKARCSFLSSKRVYLYIS